MCLGLRIVTYGKNLISESDTSHGSGGALCYKDDKHTLALGKEADATLALLVLTEGYLTHTCSTQGRGR